MGSTFGKVRKYNVHSMDPSSSFKYNTVTEDEMKPPLPGGNKDIFSRSDRPSLRSRVAESNTKLNAPHDGVNVFTTGYPSPLIPDYYNLRASGEIMIPQNDLKNDSNIKIDEGDYITLRQAIARHISSPPPPTPHPKTLLETNPPPLPPRNYITMSKTGSGYPSNSHNTAFNSNPTPSQKVYSAEDINRLLRPLNTANRRAMTLSYDRLQEPVYPERYTYMSRRYPEHYPSHHICDCHKYNYVRYYQNEYSSPPPYHSNSINPDTGPQTHHHLHSGRNHPSKHHHDYDVRVPYHYYTTPREQVNTSSVYTKYNTTSLDRDIHNHQWYRFKSPSFDETVRVPERCNKSDPQRTTDLRDPHHYQNGVTNPQNSQQNSQLREENVQSSKHKRDSFQHTETLSQPEFRSEPPTYRSLRTHPCYTIPEEESWLPPFQYNPSVHNLHRRGYQH